MARFIRMLGDSVVNLDHVMKARHVRNDGKSQFELLDKDRKLIGCVDDDDELLAVPQMLAPSWPGTRAVVINPLLSSSEHEPPTEVEAAEYDVVAWRLMEDAISEYPMAEPVFAEEIGTYEMVLIKMPDGSLCAPGNVTYENLETAKSSCLTRAQDRWYEAHRKSKKLPLVVVGRSADC
jgi:hypothetical protein